MEPYTLSRDFAKKDVIDGFSSLIWTERYYGNSQVELLVPITEDMVNKLPIGSFFGISNSDELMILETMNIKDGKIKITGISILHWLNNRFVRTSSVHKDRYWYIDSETPGKALWTIVYNMCCAGSPYLDGTNPIGIENPEQFIIPELGLYDYDASGTPIKIGVPYKQVYDAINEIATTHEIGMKIVFDPTQEPVLRFRSYKGLNRTSEQTDNPLVRFTSEMGSLTNIEELQSIAAFKTLVYSFAPGLESPLPTTPGKSAVAGQQYTGFDLRALQIFAEDITTDQVNGSEAVLLDILNNRAHDELIKNKFVKTVDGEIVNEVQFKYGIDYNLGDIIEMEGDTGTIQRARITEYIRSQDSSGEKAYPTLAAIE